MFIQEVCGSWLDSPFWQKSFMLDTPARLQTMRGYGIQEVWIDTDSGLDVRPDARVVTREEENRKVDRVLHAAVHAQEKIQHVAFHEEIDHARNIHARAETSVAAMFQEIRRGKAPQIGRAAALADEIIRSMSRNSSAFLTRTQMKNKDEYSYQHAVAVCALMIALGKQFDIEGEMLRNLGVAGLLHDAGILLIPGKILNKPQRLTDEELGIIRTHPQLGLKILKNSPGTNDVVLDVCLHHHERMDGAGYPGKLSGEVLSLAARMCTVCEVYDSIISDRPYRAGMTPARAIRKMAEWQEGDFDLEVFHAFVKTVGIYPTGTLVKLASGRLAVVVDQAAKSLLTPIVKVFFSTKINAPVFPELIDLSRKRDSIATIENPAKSGWNIGSILGIPPLGANNSPYIANVPPKPLAKHSERSNF